MDGHSALPAGRVAERCFAQAVTHCRQASVFVTYAGVDTGTEAVMTIQPGKSPCMATVRANGYSANFDGMTGPTTTSTCAVSVTKDAIHLGCSGMEPVPVE